MKLPQNKILVAIGMVGLLIIAVGLYYLLPSETSKTPETPTPNITVTKYVLDEALQAELEALKSKSTGLEQEIRGLLLERTKMVVEKNRLLARVAQLTANLQPEVTELHAQLKDRYNLQTKELNDLQALYNELLEKHNDLEILQEQTGELSDLQTSYDDLLAKYQELDTKWKASYDALLAQYEELERAHALCGVEE